MVEEEADIKTQNMFEELEEKKVDFDNKSRELNVFVQKEEPLEISAVNKDRNKQSEGKIMDNVAKRLKDAIGGLTEVLIVAIGLLVVVQIVFGADPGIDIIGNITGVVDSFVGAGASLASLVALLIVMAVLGKKG